MSKVKPVLHAGRHILFGWSATSDSPPASPPGEEQDGDNRAEADDNRTTDPQPRRRLLLPHRTAGQPGEEWADVPTVAFDTKGKTVAGAGFVQAGADRRERRRRKQTPGQVIKASQKALNDERRAVMEAEKQARRAASYLPKAGEARPQAGRSPRPLKIAPHRGTSEVLSVAYPFLAEAGLGQEGVFIGFDSWSGAVFCYDPWVLYQRGVITNPNILLAGVIGQGKSFLAKCLVTRSIAFGRKVYVPGDPKGEWTAVTRRNGGDAIELGPGTGNRLNPLDPGPSHEGGTNDVTTRRLTLLTSLTEQSLGRPLNPEEHTALHAALTHALRQAVNRNEVPTLPLVVDALFEPDDEGWYGSTPEQLRTEGRQTGHALSRLVSGDLAGLFDGPSTVPFDPSKPMVSLDLSRIQGSDTLLALVMTCASAWMNAAIADPTGGQRWVVYDEAWRIMRQPALLAGMQENWKLSRGLGIANLMAIHRMSDLRGIGDSDSAARNLALGLLADCSTRIVYRQEQGEERKTGEAIGLTETEIQGLPNLQKGEGLWRIGKRAFEVYNTGTAGEEELFDTDARMAEQAQEEQAQEEAA